LYGNNHLGDLGTDGRILQWNLNMVTQFNELRIGSTGEGRGSVTITNHIP
jgi:hypothetical protein